MLNRLSNSTDVAFTATFVHRLRVTDDVAGDDFSVLVDLLDGGDNGRARVLLIAERSVAESSDRVTQIQSQLRSEESIELTCPTILVEGGEPIKNTQTAVEEILQRIHDLNLDRRSYVIAIGGGAMLDAVGYAAAIAHRGIRLVRLPTTTLAQADSGVGVKNAINYFDKKNWIGTFAVPWAVVNDSALLETLPDREFCSGLSEAVKVSLLKDADEFHWLAEHASQISGRDPELSRRAIHRSCVLHMQHITEGGDPFEMLEARPLDFGHWSAHKLETLSRYQIRHGEAVAIGVAIDCLYSSIRFGLPRQDAEMAVQCLHDLGIQLWHPCLEPVDRLMQGLEEFRQHLGGRLTITMLRGIGDPINVHEIDALAMKTAIERLGSIAKAKAIPAN
ncbi:3-dehydroquinate synthase [Novipirellula caenicola]|uniref:3-dehydroquinate synthase n=1 Tax=Novipirellula caenicola TaxID=1536901 RepID=A0ABP9W042_9BACT